MNRLRYVSTHILRGCDAFHLTYLQANVVCGCLLFVYLLPTHISEGSAAAVVKVRLKDHVSVERQQQ